MGRHFTYSAGAAAEYHGGEARNHLEIRALREPPDHAVRNQVADIEILRRVVACAERNDGDSRFHDCASPGEDRMGTCRADPIRPNRLVKVLENAIAEVFA